MIPRWSSPAQNCLGSLIGRYFVVEILVNHFDALELWTFEFNVFREGSVAEI